MIAIWCTERLGWYREIDGGRHPSKRKIGIARVRQDGKARAFNGVRHWPRFIAVVIYWHFWYTSGCTANGNDATPPHVYCTRSRRTGVYLYVLHAACMHANRSRDPFLRWMRIVRQRRRALNHHYFAPPSDVSPTRRVITCFFPFQHFCSLFGHLRRGRLVGSNLRAAIYRQPVDLCLFAGLVWVDLCARGEQSAKIKSIRVYCY